ARTSSTAAATRRWAVPGATSTSPPSGARRSGRTRQRATRRRRPTSGGTFTTGTARHRDRSRGRRSGGGVPAGAGGHGHRPGGHGCRVDAAPATSTGAREMTATQTLRIERTFHAPAEAVFDAWTSEEVLLRWWHAGHDWETAEAEVDLRVGGAVRVVMR